MALRISCWRRGSAATRFVALPRRHPENRREQGNRLGYPSDLAQLLFSSPSRSAGSVAREIRHRRSRSLRTGYTPSRYATATRTR